QQNCESCDVFVRIAHVFVMKMYGYTRMLWMCFVCRSEMRKNALGMLLTDRYAGHLARNEKDGLFWSREENESR
ncbi:MAG TPA: hypothetical protein DHW02_18075, partial [Ktedonobacter sp.]|nr:hypothetical protein [Ktedonobacter sp.]